MKAFICLSLLLVCAFAQYEGVETQVQKLSQHRWGKLLVEIAELHTLAKGPLEDLVAHLAKLVATSTANRAAENKQYDTLENQHVKQVDYLKNQIRRAQTDIINTKTKLSNVLYPLKKQLINNIAVLRGNIRRNLATQQKERVERAEARRVFIGIQTEHRDAIAALDQALRVVDSLRNPSLVQVHILRVHLTRIENALRSHDKYEPVIESLVEMCTQSKLKDINAIRGSIKLLNELRESIVNALNEFTRIENAAIAAYNERMTQLGDELRMFQSALARDVQELSETIKRIKESILFVQVRTVDLRNRRNELKTENARWVALTALHDAFQKDITEEIDAASAALSILRNANFASWLRSKIRN